MASGDLVKLADAKAWLGSTDAPSDLLLASWITRASRAVMNELGRGSNLGFRAVTEIRDGNGGLTLPLRYWPVLLVSALSINGTPYEQQAQPPFGPGFYWEAWTGDDTQGHQYVGCMGSRFYRNIQNISISYTAGYQIQGEAYTVGSLAVISTARPWQSDQGVAYANGQALIHVASNPAQGQYTVDPTTGIYGFAAADVGAQVGITYSYVPEDLQQATLGIIAWQWKQKERVGINSKSLGGQETISFSQLPMDSLTQMMLQNFKSVIPL